MSKHKIYYLYDALCGWCYGFSPVITQFEKEHQLEFDFEVLSGGMVRGPRVGPIAKVAPYIKEAYKQVEQTTGVKFGERFLAQLQEEENSPIFDSIPAAKALTILKHMQPKKQMAFASALQKAIYFDGIAPTDITALSEVIGSFGIDKAYFIAAMETDEAGHKAAQEFALIENWGITGFPAVVVDRGDQLFLAAKGYTPYEQFKATVESILKSGPEAQK
jgi:putative protein-disulfide isomerase